MKHAYKVDIRWSHEDGVFIARVPELEGVVTDGETLVEAAKAAEKAIELHLESLKAHDEKIPEPVSLSSLSGNYALRMGRERHQDVVIGSQIENKSVNEFILDAIDAKIKVMESRLRRQPYKLIREPTRKSSTGKRKKPRSKST